MNRLVALALLVMTVTAMLPQPAEAQSGGTIRAIAVEGNRRIEAETIASYLLVKPGDRFDLNLLNQSLRRLYATGLFADAKLDRQGSTLIVVVTENPIINQVAFEGNDRIEREVLESEIELRPRVVYTRTRVQSDVQRILDLYRRDGRFSVVVQPKIIELPQNRVDLVFEIDEGPVTEIVDVSFIGNRAFSDRELRGVVITKESAWYRILSSNDVYDPDRLAVDQEELRNYYLQHGYIDFRVVSTVAELTPTKDRFAITFTLEEGERYRVGELAVDTNLAEIDPVQLEEQLTLESGDWYDAEELRQSIERLTEIVGSQGYAFVEIEPAVTRNAEARTIDLIFDIREGPRVFVERIDIDGNVRTLDRVIRREFQLVEGDPFSAAKVARSRQRIQNLGFFEGVEVTNEPGTTPDKTVIKVEVEEAPTGEISFGLGYSTIDSFLGDISLRERNLLGRGQDLRIGLSLSGRTQEWDISFTEPYFLGRDVSAGFDLFRIDQDVQDESSFNEKRTGFGLRGSYEISEYLRQSLRYTFRHTDISDVSDDASTFIKEQEGTNINSAIGQNLVYDRRDNRFAPTDGYFASLDLEFAGLGGDSKYLRTILRGAYYHELIDDVILIGRGEYGYVWPWDDEVLISDRFFLGGAQMRGFKFAGIGPRDISTDDALGGNQYYVVTGEVEFPLGLPEELGLTGRVFTDIGSLWDVDASGPTVRDSDAPRLSVGVGFSWNSPFGPIRVDFANPLLKEDYDQTEAVRFSFGTRF